MKRSILAALAATVSLPLVAAPALAQQDDPSRSWREYQRDAERRIPYAPDHYATEWDYDRHGGRRGEAGARHGHSPERYATEWEYRQEMERRRRARDRWADRPDYDREFYRRNPPPGYEDRHHGGYEASGYGYRHGHDRDYGDREFRRDFGQDGRRGYYQDSQYEGMPHDDEHVARMRDRMGDHREWLQMQWEHGYTMHGADRRRGPGMGQIRRAMRMIDKYDTDKDGRVTQEEVDQFRSDRLTQFDGDGDKSLSLEEYERLWLDAMRERMVDRFQEHDADGDGLVTIEEFSASTRDVVRMRDRDGDNAFSYGDFGPRGGEEWRRMHEERRSALGEEDAATDEPEAEDDDASDPGENN